MGGMRQNLTLNLASVVYLQFGKLPWSLTPVSVTEDITYSIGLL